MFTSSTNILSTLLIVESLCAIVIEVLPTCAASSASCTICNQSINENNLGGLLLNKHSSTELEVI